MGQPAPDKSDKAAALALIPVSRETEARLDRYLALLREWQAKTNLIAPSTLPKLWTRHVADTLQLLKLAPSAKTWADFGSGGGFPGVVLACALAETSGAMVHLIERNGKKAAFLREALRVVRARGSAEPCADRSGPNAAPACRDIPAFPETACRYQGK